MDIVAWLRDLGLDQYEVVFRDNAIDKNVLPSLTSDDLKEIGVGPVGHRRRMLDAIDVLKSGQGRSPSRELPPGGNTEVPRGLQTPAERRLLTLMFVDLVGSTAMSAGLDPEDMRVVITAYHKAVANGVEAQKGFVAKYMGDGVLAYFGYPTAQENDAERAVRAGLAICENVAKLVSAAPKPLSARVGIATGIVVVGDLIGSGEASERSVVGDTPNLAARLQSIAQPNQVVVAEDTRRLVGNLFQFQDLGNRELKGIPRPVRAHLAVRAQAVESRFDALKGEDMSPLVGRIEVLSQLGSAWSRAAAAEGQVILVSGEAGIGKSRLTAALMERIADERHAQVRYFCAPQDANSAFAPFLGQVERAAGIQREDDAQSNLTRYLTFMQASGIACEEGALVADSLGFSDSRTRTVIENMPSQVRRQKLIEAFVSGVVALSRTMRTLIIFEDAHWADPSSLEVLGRIVESVAPLQILLLITFRPEFKPPWLESPSISTLTLNRLSPQETLSLISRTCGDASLPQDVVHEIAERTDGVPLFVEEITKAILEARTDTRNATARTMIVPASLQASLTARLDRLGRAKELAQIGAAMGREFSYQLIRAVAPFSESDLDLALEHLHISGILFRYGAGQDATFVFKHALLQDAAHGMMLREVRRKIHSQIANAMLAVFPEFVSAKPEAAAHHFSEAGLKEEAAVHWGSAGFRSVSRSAYVEAIAFFSKAIAELALAPPTSERRREEIKIQLALASTLFHVRGYTSTESVAAFESAKDMIEQADAYGEHIDAETNLQRYCLMYGIWTGQFVSGRFFSAQEKAQRFLAMAEQQSLSAPLLMAHRVMGATCAIVGDFSRARLHLDKVINLYEPGEHSSLASRLGHDLGVAGRAYRGYVLYRLGFPTSAQMDTDKAIEIGRELGQIGTLIYALFCAAIVNVNCGAVIAANKQIEEVIALAEKHALPYWKAYGGLIQGEYLAAIGDAEQAIVTLNSGLEGMHQARSVHLSPQGFMWQARAYSSLGRYAQAGHSLKAAVARMQAANERWDEAEIRRTVGELALAKGGATSVAKMHFLKSLEVARSQNAKLFEMRSLVSLAKLPCDHGPESDTIKALVRACDWFTEGRDSAEFQIASAISRADANIL